MLLLQNLDIGYDKILVENINLNLKKGIIVALLGVNGAGKTTFFKTLAKIQKPLRGKIFIENQLIDNFSQKDLAKKVSFLTNRKFDIPNLKVKDFIQFGYFPYAQNSFDFYNQRMYQNFEKIVNYLKINHLTEKEISKISDGEWQKVNFARVLMQDTDIFLLDEPSAFFDIKNKFFLFQVLNDLKVKNKIVIFSTHDINTAVNLADYIMLINNKKMIFDLPESLIYNDVFQKVFSPSNAVFNKYYSDFFVIYPKNYPLKIYVKSKDKLRNFLIFKILKKNGYFADKNASDFLAIFDDYCILKKNNKTLKINSFKKLQKAL